MTELPPADSSSPHEEGTGAAPEEVFVFPLSFAQQRLWFLHQLEPAGAAYNMPVAFRLSGRLDVSALERALNEMVSRHEILRTTFDVLDEQPVQLVSAAAQTLTPALMDLSALPATEREAEAARLAEEEVGRPFDLGAGPLLRALLLRLGAEEHVLLLTAHHIISDGWSQGVLIGELGVLYEAFAAGRESPLPPLPIQYADFAEWQRGWLQGEELERQLAYWRGRLAGAPPSLELPTDRARPPAQSFNGARESFALSRELSSRLAELSLREDATLYMTLLAAFKVLLSRCAGQSDIVVGTPVANRGREELEGLVGFFVNTLALRTDLSGDPTFLELLGRVREVCLGAYAHQDAPFEMLVEELRPVRDASRNPLFQVMFALQNTPEPAFGQSELVASPFEVKTGRAQFDLTLDAAEADGQIQCSLVYNTDLFDARTVRLMAERFRVLLEGVAADAGRAISALPLLTRAERRLLLFEWNDTRRDVGGEVCAHELFEAQAEREPDRVAVVFEDRRVTYGELNRRANRLAHYLLDAGVGPESLVGLMLERSVELVVALLGVLKAGAAYVPLDPAHPPARLSYLIDDARISVLLTDLRSSARIPPRRARVIRLDAEADAAARRPDINPPRRAGADNAAYVIYTSGSTGAPKGVVVAHRGVCNLVAAQVEAFNIRRESRVLQFASAGFDAAVSEVFTALAAGARLCLVSRETLLSGAGLVELQREQGVTVATLPPSLLAVLSPDEWPTLETLVSAGERCPAEIAARWSKGRRFVNAYGPTEATVCATAYVHDGARAGEPPIGRPISNTRCYLLDERLNLVPAGAAGELHIGGAGLARGYLNRPALTAERFVPDPFSLEPGARLYRTGDYARYLPDGNLVFLGRRDAQLKIHGFRIEPGEIEAALEEHAAVSAAAVLAREDRPGEKRLVAYVLAKPGAALTGEELRAFSRQRLPEHMTPSAFVLLDEAPLTLNGKLDRAALPAPPQPRADGPGARVAPRDLLESQLAGIWEELLNVEPDVRDDFFELGGHSLLAVRLLGRVEQVTGKRLDVASLFRAPTVEGLALLLRGEAKALDPSPLVALQPRGSLRPVFFVHPAGGGVFSYLALARRLGAERPFYGLEATGTEGGIELMAAAYAEAVRAADPAGPYLLGGWSTGGVVAFEVARQLQARGAEVALVVLLDSAAPGHVVADDAALFSGFAVNLGVTPERLAAAPERLLGAGTEERLEWILEEARRAQLLPPDASLARLRRSFDLYLSTVKALENYRPPASPVPVALLRAAGAGEGAEAADWSRLSTAKLDVWDVPGDHLTMMREPHVSALAEILRARLAEAERPGAR
ncbi:MAG TPA: amino acid adenylation domain-containing protein, partial [Pyrinomonadaceae bacterium]